MKNLPQVLPLLFLTLILIQRATPSCEPRMIVNPPSTSLTTLANARLIQADLDGDATADLVVFKNSGASPTILTLQGTPTGYAAPTTVPVSVGQTFHAVAGEISGGGVEDVVFAESGNVFWLEGDGSGSLVAVKHSLPSVMTSPSTVGLAHLNPGEDSHIDVLVAGDELAYWLASPGGGGSFEPGVVILSLASRYVVGIDFDSSPDPGAEVLVATSTGVFWIPVTSPAPLAFGTPVVVVDSCNNAGVQAGDVNQDGRMDAIYGGFQGRVGVLFNTGEGPPSETVITVENGGFLPYAGLSDLNGDGVLDVVISFWLRDAVRVAYGIDGTSFLSPVTVMEGSPDYDGVASIGIHVHPTTLRRSIVTATNVGSVLFHPTSDADVGYGDDDDTIILDSIAVGARQVLAADFTGDGILDVMFMARNPDRVVVHVGLGLGAFADPITLHDSSSPLYSTPRYGALADLNADGVTDILMLTYSPTLVVGYVADGTGSFENPVVLVPAGDYTHMALGRIDDDPHFDIVFWGGSLGTQVAYSTGYNPVTGLVGFTSPVAVNGICDYLGGVGDMNGDGLGDLAFPVGTSIYVQLALPGGGMGTPVSVFDLPPVLPDGGVDPEVMYVEAADFDPSTPYMDLVVYTRGNNTRVIVLENDGSGGSSFVPLVVSGPFTIPPGTSNSDRAVLILDQLVDVRDVVAADANLDGVLDIVIGVSGGDGIFLALGTPGPSLGFATPVLMARGDHTWDISVGDADSDGVLDLFGVYEQGQDVGLHLAARGTAMPRGSHAALSYTTMAGHDACAVELASRPSSVSSACLASVLQTRASPCLQGGLYMSGVTMESCFAVRPHRMAPFDFELDGLEADCSAHGGVLFALESGGRLKMSRAKVTGASSAVGAFEGATVLSVSGSGSVLEVVDSVFVNTSSARASAVTHQLGGFGSVAAVGSDGTLRIESSMLLDSTASDAGGVVAVTGPDATLVVSNCTIRGSTALGMGGGAVVVAGTRADVSMRDTVIEDTSAPDGSGGVLLVHPLGVESGVVLEGLNVTDVSAGRAGGAVASLGAPGSRVVIGGGSVIERASAEYGGVFAVTDVGSSELVTPAFTRGRLPGGVGGGSLEVGGGTVLGSGSANQGGLAYVCGGFGLNMSGATGTGPFVAGQCGGAVFTCPVWNELGPSPQSPMDAWGLILPPGLGSVSSAGSYGDLVASGPVRMVVEEDLEVEVMSGLPMSQGILRLVDVYGTTVVGRLATAYNVLVEPVTGSPNAGRARVGAAALGGTRAEDGLLVASGTLSVGILGWSDGGGETQWPVVLSVGLDTPGSAQFEDLVSVVMLRLCEPGFGRASAADGSVALICAACSEGSESNATSSETCTPILTCPEGQIPEGGTCVACEGLATRLSNTSCSCLAGAYTPVGALNTPCLACPVGGVCAGSVAPPVADAGWFAVGTNEFEACRVGASCLGGNVCEKKYAGFMCKDCAPDTYRVSNAECRACGGVSTVLIVIGAVCLVMVVVGAVGVSVWAGRETFSTAGGMKKGGRGKKIPRAVSVLVLYLQTVGLLASAPLDWPASVRAVLEFASSASSDVFVFPVGCSVAGYYTTLVLVLVAPVVVGCVVVMFAVFVVKRGGGGGVGLGPLVVRTGAGLGSLAYLPVAKTALGFFDCTRLPDGRAYLDADPTVECFDGEWNGYVGLAGAGVVVYVIGFPAGVAWRLWRARARGMLSSSAVVQYTWEPFVGATRDAHYLYGVLLLLKRLVIVVLTLFVSNAQEWLVALLMVTFVGSLVATSSWQPFMARVENTLEIRLDMALSGLIVCGAVFWANDFASNASRTAFVVVFVAILVFGLVSILWMGVVEVLGRGGAAGRRVVTPEGGGVVEMGDFNPVYLSSSLDGDDSSGSA